MPLLVNYTLKSIFTRKMTSSLTIAGLALVVFVFAASFMLSNGLRQTLISTGYDENVMAVRKGATAETISIVPLAMERAISADQDIAVAADGGPLSAGELLILISRKKIASDDASNVTVRGISNNSTKIRPNFNLVEGRMFSPGTSEMIVGRKIQTTFEGFNLGDSTKFGGRNWTVVGIFESDGSGFESEVWSGWDQISDAFNRPIYSSVTFRLKPNADFEALKKRLENDPRLTVDVSREKDFYANQSNMTTTFITIMAVVISLVFFGGAVIGAMITMYASVANRVKEIGTLRALGFRRRNILFAFLIESVMIAGIGGVIGLALATLLRYVEVSTTNWDTFVEVAFSFEISTDIVIASLIFAIAMGLLGGLLPAIRASRLKIINALRAK